MKRIYDAEFFDGRCPYTDRPCYEWECDTCEVDVQEKESMKAVDDAEYKEWIESDPQKSDGEYEYSKVFIRENFEPVEDKPGYVWFSKRNFQIISIETLANLAKQLEKQGQ